MGPDYIYNLIPKDASFVLASPITCNGIASDDIECINNKQRSSLRDVRTFSGADVGSDYNL